MGIPHTGTGRTIRSWRDAHLQEESREDSIIIHRRRGGDCGREGQAQQRDGDQTVRGVLER